MMLIEWSEVQFGLESFVRFQNYSQDFKIISKFSYLTSQQCLVSEILSNQVSDLNCTTQSSNTTWLHPLGNQTIKLTPKYSLVLRTLVSSNILQIQWLVCEKLDMGKMMMLFLAQICKVPLFWLFVCLLFIKTEYLCSDIVELITKDLRLSLVTLKWIIVKTVSVLTQSLLKDLTDSMYSSRCQNQESLSQQFQKKFNNF